MKKIIQVDNTKKGLEKYAGYFFLLSLIIIIVLAFLLIKPYISSIFSGIILAYLFYPIYKLLGRFKITKNKNFRAFIICALIVIIILLPMIFISQVLFKESISIYNEYIKTNSIQLTGFANEEVNEFAKEAIKETIVYVSVGARQFIQLLPSKILHFFIVMFLVFYFLKDGERVVNDIKEFIPMESHKQDKLIKEFSEITYSVVFGIILTSVAQGIVSAIGFYLFGVSSPIIWGIITMILAVLPFVGPAFVYIPLGLLQVYEGSLFIGIGIMIFGALFVSTLDNIIRPKLIGSKGKIHPALIFIGLIGGLNLFGLVGLVLGPLILSYLLTFLKFIE